MDLDLIDRTKYRKDLLSAYDDVSMELEALDRQPPVNAIHIPDGATNGDMIMAMFPNIECIEDELENVFIISSAQSGHIALRECWWNTPYKMESEE